MKKTNQIQSNNLFRQAVLLALMEQGKIDTAPLKAFLINILECHSKTDDERIGWLKNENTLVIFFNLLKNQGFISCELDLFKSHFKGINQTKEKIIWQSNINELVNLFDRLRDEGIIPLCKNPHILLREKFLDKYEKPLNAGSLRTLLEKGIRNEKRVEIIDEIINNILKVDVVDSR